MTIFLVLLALWMVMTAPSRSFGENMMLNVFVAFVVLTVFSGWAAAIAALLLFAAVCAVVVGGIAAIVWLWITVDALLRKHTQDWDLLLF